MLNLTGVWAEQSIATASSDVEVNSRFMTLTVYRSAKGAAARRQGTKELASPFGGAPDTAPVLRVFGESRMKGEVWLWKTTTTLALQSGGSYVERY